MTPSNAPGNDLVDKIWSVLLEKQNSINRQLEEYDRRVNLQSELNSRLIEESEKKLFKRIDRRNLEMKEIDHKIKQQLEKNKVKIDEIPEKENKDQGRKRAILGKTNNITVNNYSAPIAEENEIKESPAKTRASIIKGFKKKGWKVYGAVSGEQLSAEDKKEIKEAGFFVLEKYGSSFVLDGSDDFMPSEH
ncbi:MAG: hypothetical protein FWD28_00535 [Treponema sp.]|nr:hypothetical protein [Treponema sp.]